MIRPATVDDIDAVTTLGLAFLSSGHYAGMLGINEDALRAYMARLIASAAADILTDPDGHGMIGVQCGAHPMSGEITAGEVFWYVKPDMRHGLGGLLMKAAEAWARERGAKRMQMTAPDDRIGNLYTRRGFKRVETVYQKDLI